MGITSESATSIAAATARLAATLQEMRGELEYTRQLTELARMTGEVRALAAELAATQRAFLEAERAAASHEVASLRRAPVEPPPRVEYRPLPARPRAVTAAAPVVPPPDPRVELAGELVDLRGLVERVADEAQHDELAARLERFRRRLQDPAADCEAMRTEIAVVRALLYRALKPKRVGSPVKEEGRGAAGPAAASPVVEPRAGRVAAAESNLQQLRTAVVGLAALVVAMLGMLVWSNRRAAPVEPVAVAKNEEPVAPEGALPPEGGNAAAHPVAAVGTRGQSGREPVALGRALPQTVQTTAGEFVDEAGRFRCELPEGWEVTADSSAALSSLRLVSGRDEILALSRPAMGERDLRDRARLERQLATRINHLISGELFAEVVEAKWVPADEVEALQMVLRVAVGAETWRVLAVNYQQHGLDHLLVLYVRSEGNEARLQATFQKFVYRYDGLGQAEEPAAELPFLRGVVAEAMARSAGAIR